MRRFKPVYGVFLVILVVGAVLTAELALDGRLGGSSYTRVSPGPDRLVRIDLSGLRAQQVRFFRFLNPSNQEVKFFVGRDAGGEVQVAFDADEVCAKNKRGFRQDGEWVICNKCDKSFRLSEVNAGGGGCKPVPLQHQVLGSELLIAEADILQGWRFFR
jgi:uncharacterized membrane protein